MINVKDFERCVCVPMTAIELTNIFRKSGIQCARWLDENCTGQYQIMPGQGTIRAAYLIYFESEIDAILFKLKWG